MQGRDETFCVPVARAQPRRDDSPTSTASVPVEVEEVSGLVPAACGPGFRLFSGCDVCVLGDTSRAVPVVERLEPRLDTSSSVPLCGADRRVCGAKVDENVEEVDDTTSLGDDDQSVASVDDARGVSTGNPPFGRAVVQDVRDDAIHRELEVVRAGAGRLFESRGWNLQRVSSGRYRFGRRTVKLFLLPPNAGTPCFSHLQQVLDYGAAERAARIMVCDGSLRQPLLDYLMQTGENESYDERGTENIAGVSGAARYLDWNTQGTDDRILEMAAATFQADVRRSAAGEQERVSALQSEGVRLLSRNPSGLSGGSNSLPNLFGRIGAAVPNGCIQAPPGGLRAV